MSAAEWMELARRCETGSEDAGLDADICVLAQYGYTGRKGSNFRCNEIWGELLLVSDIDGIESFDVVPELSTCVDSGIAIIEETLPGCFWSVNGLRSPGGKYVAHIHTADMSEESEGVSASASTSALALRWAFCLARQWVGSGSAVMTP